MDTNRVLSNVRYELALLGKGECCDHSVGICWCSYFATLEELDLLILELNGYEQRMRPCRTCQTPMPYDAETPWCDRCMDAAEKLSDLEFGR